MRALRKHTDCRWALFCAEQWLKAPIQNKEGNLIKRSCGVPQGGVISPLLSNLLLHYVFDKWIRKHYPQVEFERYADDIVVHCKTEDQANLTKSDIEKRLAECKLSLNEQKTKIVYTGIEEISKISVAQSFDYLGYTFRRRLTRSKAGKQFVGFLPAISNKAKSSTCQTIKRWRIHQHTKETIEKIAKWTNPQVQGWINYYGKFYRSEMETPLKQIEYYLKRWVRSKFKKNTGKLGINKALRYLGQVRKHNPRLFAHWAIGV